MGFMIMAGLPGSLMSDVGEGQKQLLHLRPRPKNKCVHLNVGAYAGATEVDKKQRIFLTVYPPIFSFKAVLSPVGLDNLKAGKSQTNDEEIKFNVANVPFCAAAP